MKSVKYIFSKTSLLFLCHLFLCTGVVSTQTDDVRMFIFGHSLIDHRPPAIPTPSNETTVAHWVYLLAEAAGQNYAAGGQYGFLPQHANLPPIAQWGYDVVPGVWESDTEPFSAADISTVLLTAGNFMQWQSPLLDYPTDPGVRPVSATETILDWVGEQEDSVKFYIYENWPDMAPFLSNGFPPSTADFDDYNTYLRNDFHDWWLTYQDELLNSRPDANIRMIPVGPIISKLLTDELPEQIPLTELYEDDAPHGRASLYFLAGLISYMAVYETPATTDFNLPAIVHPVIVENYNDIVTFIWQELASFNDENGNTRVFCANLSTNTAEIVNTSFTSKIIPNPNHGQFQIVSTQAFDQVDIVAIDGRLQKRFRIAPLQVHDIDLRQLPAGFYYVRIISNANNHVELRKVVIHE